jgi:DNA-binding response OmpR family regulator
MTQALRGKRVLIVEDEYFIAADLRRVFGREGAEVVGPAANLELGLELATQAIDVALLDVNLGDALSYPIADALRDRSVPYLFLTGYDGWSLPRDYQEDPRLAKPFTVPAVLALAERLIAAEREAA